MPAPDDNLLPHEEKAFVARGCRRQGGTAAMTYDGLGRLVHSFSTESSAQDQLTAIGVLVLLRRLWLFSPAPRDARRRRKYWDNGTRQRRSPAFGP